MSEERETPIPNDIRHGRVTVRRHWSDYRTLDVRVNDLKSVFWSDTSGGVKARSPRKFIHAVVSCELIPKGSDFPHSCQHGRPPHSIQVCIVKKDNSTEVISYLAKLANNKG